MELLLAVARTGSLNAAAVQCGVTQQAASQRMRSIEAQLGLSLIQRGPRGSALTPSGVVVAQWCTRVLDAARELDAGVAALRADHAAHLRIRASLTIAEYLLPGWLMQLHDRSPHARIELRTENSGAVPADITARHADLGFTETATAPAGVRSKIIGHDQLVLVVPRGHPWTRRRTPLTAELVARTPMVAREQGSGTRQAYVAALRAALGGSAQISPPALELDTATAIRAAVLGGVAPAVLSALAVADDIQLGRLRAVPLPGVGLRRPLRAIWLGAARPPAGLARDVVSIAAQMPSPAARP
jgi:DNA-binding transcriptional LysR family regulator